MKLTPHEQKVLELVKRYPEIVHDPQRRREVAAENGLTEKTLRNRIGDLKKYNLIRNVPQPEATSAQSAYQIKDDVLLVEEERVRPLWKLLKTLYQHRWGLVGVNGVIAVAAVVILLLLPKWYQSSATFVVKQESTVNIGEVVSNAINIGMGYQTGDVTSQYLAYLQSRRILDQIIARFNLEEVYEVKYRDDVYSTLLDNCSFTDNEDGTITISCMYKEDPVKASEMANAFYDYLYNLTLEIEQKNATDYREYIAENTLLAQKSLRSLEEEFKNFQKKYGIYSVEDQIRVAVENLASMELEKVKIEIEYNYLANRYSDRERPEVMDLKLKLRSINEKIEQMKSDKNYMQLAMIDIPEKSMHYLRYYRDILVQEKIVEFLTLKLEQAKLEERKTTANIFLLDKATPSEKKAWPPRTTYFLITMFFSGILSLLYFRLKDIIASQSEHLKTVLQST